MDKDIRTMTLPERYKYINELKSKKYNPTTEEKKNKDVRQK